MICCRKVATAIGSFKSSITVRSVGSITKMAGVMGSVGAKGTVVGNVGINFVFVGIAMLAEPSS